jgi:Carboxypeptidase regulatory-like domain
MKRVALLVATSVALAGCEKKRDLTTGPIATPTYVLFGAVRDSSGAPVAGALAEIITGGYKGRSALTNQSGYFTFIGLNGPLTVRVDKEDYEASEKTVDVKADLQLDVIIRKLYYADSIELGRTIRSNVSASSSPCDPVQWDARAPCRRFRFIPRSSGFLSIQIKWDGLIPLDATIVTLRNAYIATSRDAGFGVVTIVASLTAGETYEVRINSFYGALTFDLTADFEPL